MKRFLYINGKRRMLTLQLLGWGVILGTSIFWSIASNSDVFDRFALIRLTINIAILMVIYMVNYLLFIPKFLFKGQRRNFFLVNSALILLLLLASYHINELDLFGAFRPADMPNDNHRRPTTMFLVRDMINYVLMVGLVTALRLADRLQKSEEALREAESARVKAELANLRSQINPHFLLNTLNNIYALTAIDTDKAQKTIKELSDLLRYILYDNLEEHVSLTKEVEFLKSYIELMSIRLPKRVELTTQFDIDKNSSTLISPLIFISLIENAFKHSVGANGDGFIDIHFEEDIEQREVRLSISNSNCAKADHDKSGHGVGLEQVRRRLELLYPDRHSYHIESTNEVYSSQLTLKI